MKNPPWARDEIILALNLYFELDSKEMTAKNTEVIKLSELLNKLPIYSYRPDKEKFRNPNGVSYKLSNFKHIDPSYIGKGSKGHSKLDKEIFFEFNNNKDELKSICETIYSLVDNKKSLEELYKIEEETSEELTVKEGKVLYKLHKVRERSHKIVNQKKKEYLKKFGKLDCEVCGFDFFEAYGEIGLGFIEAHHKTPLNKLDVNRVVRTSDLALVCSNCHRMIHRKISELSIDELRARLNLSE